MTFRLAALALLTVVILGPAHGAALTQAEAVFLGELVTAATVLERRCSGYEANGAGGVQRGAKLLGSPAAAMAMISAYDAAIKANDSEPYDATKFRAEVSDASRDISSRVRAHLTKHPREACAEYGDRSVSHGLLRRY
jgi:hypothetical protein